MNVLTSNILSTTNEDSLKAFQTFVNKLQHAFDQENDHAFASVSLTCYRQEKLDQYRGIILLITCGHGIGNIRISDGESELMNEPVYQVLERKDKHYSLGRSENVLTIDCVTDSANDIFRIDIEECATFFTGAQSTWHQLESLSV